jgi:hypothetical protein
VVGIAVIGTVFFTRLEDESFTDAFTAALPIVAGLYVAAALLSLVLPHTAVAEEEEEEAF